MLIFSPHDKGASALVAGKPHTLVVISGTLRTVLLGWLGPFLSTFGNKISHRPAGRSRDGVRIALVN